MSPAAAIAAVVLGVAAVRAQEPAIEVPLAIAVRDSAEPGQVDLEITNLGTRRAVAWAFDIVGADGGRSGTLQDVFVQLLVDRPDDRILLPGVPTIVGFRPADQVLGATITATAVVYDDATAVGAPEPISRVFARRRDAAAALAEVIPRLEALAAAGLNVTALRAAAAAFDAEADTKPGFVQRGLARNLALFARSDTPPDAGFHHMLERMRRELALTREHAVRR